MKFVWRFSAVALILAALLAAGAVSSPGSRAGTNVIVGNPVKGVNFECGDYTAAPPSGTRIYSNADDDTITSEMGTAASGAGASWTRIFVDWANAETASQQVSSSYMSALDYCVSDAEANGMKVLFTLYHVPQWASGTTDQRVAPSDCLSAGASCSSISWFMNYLTTHYEHYGAGNIAFEIWNEPNNPSSYWSSGEQDYYYFLKAAYGAVKAANASVTVAVGQPAVQLSLRDLHEYLPGSEAEQRTGMRRSALAWKSLVAARSHK